MNGHKENCGIIYIAFGYDYLLMAAHSAATAKETNPGIKCLVITNLRFDNQKIQPASPFDYVTVIEKESRFNREIKTNIVRYTPFERSLFLDCDTEVRGSLDPAFRCLDNFDLAVKMNHSQVIKSYEIAPGISGDLFPEFSSGAIFFKNNDRAKKLFEKWSQFFMEEGKRTDQPTLARAIYHTPEVKLLPLGNIWNAYAFDLVLLRNGLSDVIIWHYRHPHMCPELAPAIYNMHRSFSIALIDPPAATLKEIEAAARRYKFISMLLYRLIARNRLAKRLNLVKLLVRAKRYPKFDFKRPVYRSGDKYSRIKQ